MADPRLQRYQIMEPLGRGSQGTTYRGIDRANGTEVAIKVLSLGELENWKGFDLFERECRVLARLSHPAIPRFIDHYDSADSGDYFLVMELVDGRPLHLLRSEEGPLPHARLGAVFRQALEALDYLGQQTPPVVHRDIKPSNLILDSADKLHIVDFGGVRDALRVDGGSTIVGTYGYMAPEQLHGEATGATDLYALGATMTSLITGVEPQDMPRQGLVIDLDRLLPRHPWRPLLGRLLEPNPSQRISTPQAALAALDGLGATNGRPTGPAPKAPAAPPPRKENLPVPYEELHALAKSDRRPLAVLIWLMTALGSGALTLVQAIILPLFYKFLRTFGQEKHRKNYESEEAIAVAAVSEQRRTLKAISEAAHPFR